MHQTSNMASLSHEFFPNSPIILSIIQFRYDKIEALDYKKLMEIGKTINSTYPSIKEQFTRNLDIKELEVTSVTLGDKITNGVVFLSKDNKQSITINEEKFTFQKHGNYNGWDDFIKDFKDNWEVFNSVLGIETLKGLSVRVVNRFNLPMNIKSPEEYFTTFINTNSGTLSIGNFQFKYTARDASKNMHWNIAHSLERAIDNKITYIFDIDVLINENIPNDKNLIWEKFNLIREKKNSIFNDGITEKTKTLVR